ncbi:uncharacterized protein LOC134292581 [Anolis carolinensis]|uniref:uncharacterized protein LOC134292581 n=1 Tax=Anolis carolinensis TaxID=28377 RepID=UPI002F2B7948|nr:interferon-upsilon [Anolis carolinensis]
MHWFQSLVFLAAGCVFNHAFPSARLRSKKDICLSKIDWRKLWQQIDRLNASGVSQECQHMDKSSLCDPDQMGIMNISEEVPIILQILNETAALFERKDTPFSDVREVLEYNYVTQEDLENCLQSHFNHHHLTEIKECFGKMQTFLNNENSRCAWQVVHENSFVILQHLEFYMATSLMN